ncbi:hypothetical protein LU699_13010 [Luteimonas fraxinea]|uniref:Mechanosensitive ion channel family protein n=1 Tax=Luteimonas fraxinea TaxID=2901869 RepID=A0ABS8UEY6_9GAMM|nr:hypothetical protein [Luteimonas fraxinea]MCD9098067.1 hypothetical protein [Luteimonas fraxinea]UHH09208.1 hypothetical protein LU699_13010 [Luteimonas fraxinea]
MNWLMSLLQAIPGDNPFIALVVVVLAFVFLIYRLGIRVLTTIERVAKSGGRR